MGIERDIEIERPKSFWCNTEDKADNPTLILAQLLLEKGLPIRISGKAQDKLGREVPGHVEIHAEGEGGMILNNILATPEMRVLKTSYWDLAPNVGVCEWDSRTKRRIVAKYWQDRIAHAPPGISGTSDIYKRLKARVEEFANETPLRPDEIRSLLEPMVEEVLAQEQSHQAFLAFMRDLEPKLRNLRRKLH